jgi:hypothetical protein
MAALPGASDAATTRQPSVVATWRMTAPPMRPAAPVTPILNSAMARSPRRSITD